MDSLFKTMRKKSESEKKNKAGPNCHSLIAIFLLYTYTRYPLRDNVSGWKLTSASEVFTNRPFIPSENIPLC